MGQTHKWLLGGKAGGKNDGVDDASNEGNADGSGNGTCVGDEDSAPITAHGRS